MEKKTCSVCNGKYFAKGRCEKHYYQHPDVIARRRAYQQRPDVIVQKRAYNRAYEQRPERKAALKVYQQRPEYKEYMKVYHQRPEVKAKMKAYQDVYYRLPDVKAHSSKQRLSREKDKELQKQYLDLLSRIGGVDKHEELNQREFVRLMVLADYFGRDLEEWLPLKYREWHSELVYFSKEPVIPVIGFRDSQNTLGRHWTKRKGFKKK